MDKFCGSEFWNLSVTWNTNDPQFTPCFQRTVLVWLPCAFLWLFTPLEISYIRSSINRNIPYGFLNVCKLLLTGALIVLTSVDLAVVLISQNVHEVYPVDYYTPVIKIVTFILSAVLLQSNRKFGLRTSGIQFLFWLVLVICGTPQLLSQFRNQYKRHDSEIQRYYDEYFFTSYLIFYLFSLTIWFLNCFADGEPLQTKYPRSDKPYPEQSASFLSRLVFAWFDPLAWQGYKAPLEQNDLWDISPERSSQEIIPAFLKNWDRAIAKQSAPNDENELVNNESYNGISTSRSALVSLPQEQKREASILPTLWKTFGMTFLCSSSLRLVVDCLNFLPPQLLSAIIDFVDSSNNSASDGSFGNLEHSEHRYLWHGIFYAIMLFIVVTAQTICFSQYFQRIFMIGLRIRTSLIGAIYQKALRLSNTARKESTVGEIVNLMSVDAQHFMDVTSYVNTIWSAPLQIALASYFLWRQLGPSVLAGLAVMIVLIPINGVISNKVNNLLILQMNNKDERIKLMNEILSGIKVLKLYAWEPSFQEQVQKIREKEIKVLRQAAYLNAGTTFIWNCAPFLVALVSFTCFVLVSDKNVLDAKTAFVSLSLFNILRAPLSILPTLITHMIEANVSLKRINKFMNSEELDPRDITHDSSDAPLEIENGTFSWGDGEAVLKNINLQVKKNNLVAMVGTVGAGKSSIISAFLGEMDKISGSVNTFGTVAYVSQQAWIQNASLQDNILFGKPMDRRRYNQVIKACALKTDIEILPGGDATEIGEKGINLSGGQKQRVALARAVYNDADCYFLDDPLSAVDAHVGKHIFENVIGPTGLLATKTRLLVTHGITYLSNVDNIYVVKSGEISESGTLKELITKKGDFADFLLQHLQDVNESEEDLNDIKQQIESTLGTNTDTEFRAKFERAISRTVSESHSDTSSLNEHELSKPIENGQQLIEEEKSGIGNVKSEVYKYYFKSIGVMIAISAVILNIAYQSFEVGSNVWLSKWSNDKSTTNDTGARNLYLGVYAAFGLGQLLFSFATTIILSMGFIRSAKVLQENLLSNVLRWPMHMFDTTPVGRLLNRFSKDLDTVDNDLPAEIENWIMLIFELVSTCIVISVSTYLFLTVIIPIGIIYYFFQRLYVTTSRQLNRLESVALSPIYSHFGESIQGAPTIRAFNLQKRFIKESEEKIDIHQKCYVPYTVAERWLDVRIESIGNLIIFFAALFAVLSRGTVNPGLVGLSITYALQISLTLNWMVFLTSHVETNIVAVERIKEYTETKQEAPWNIPNMIVPKNWPERGKVEFKNFELRYREGLDLVLRNISFTINECEKVGIVGRTGAGKSSLTLALFRIIEPAGGSIIIDGIDISKIGLHSLRSGLTIIPQDPVLFSGSLRLNLDPFEQKSDEEVWRALELAHLKSFVQGLTAGLSHEVSEGGENLSVGQRQLICLARALLRKTKVLILDEATAAVDLETDDLIQKTIRNEFKDCTILTIAHRLNTIIDADKIIVLDKGRISEFDSPKELLANKSSAFYSMAQDAGLVQN